MCSAGAGQMCAGGGAGDSCAGDSGSALMLELIPEGRQFDPRLVQVTPPPSPPPPPPYHYSYFVGWSSKFWSTKMCHQRSAWYLHRGRDLSGLDIR